MREYCSELRDLFSLSLKQLEDIVHSFHEEMDRGLRGGKSSLAMLPTYARRPTGSEVGEFLVLDMGGTFTRVQRVSLKGRRKTGISYVKSYTFPYHVMVGDCEDLFEFLAICLEDFLRDYPCNGGIYPLAFTFSFPVEHTSLCSGRLLKWTKEFTVRDVIGRDVSELLNNALERRGMGFIRVASLINDTVATLVAGAYGDSSCDMGMILGTGTNASYFENWSRVVNPPPVSDTSEMIINMEWGNFNRIERNMFDEMLDQMSPHPGEQMLEKMTSGKYLGEVMRLVVRFLMDKGVLPVREEGLGLLGQIRSEYLALLMRGDRGIFALLGLESLSNRECRLVSTIARMLLERSSRLIGAAIVAVVKWMDPDLKHLHTVAVDGSLFTQNTSYRRMIGLALREILKEKSGQVRLSVLKDGSAIGSAVSASYALANYRRSM